MTDNHCNCVLITKKTVDQFLPKPWTSRLRTRRTSCRARRDLGGIGTCLGRRPQSQKSQLSCLVGPQEFQRPLIVWNHFAWLRHIAKGWWKWKWWIRSQLIANSTPNNTSLYINHWGPPTSDAARSFIDIQPVMLASINLVCAGHDPNFPNRPQPATNNSPKRLKPLRPQDTNDLASNEKNFFYAAVLLFG